MPDEPMVSVPAKLLTRLAEIDTDRLGAAIDPDDSEADAIYADIDAIGAVAQYAVFEVDLNG